MVAPVRALRKMDRGWRRPTVAAMGRRRTVWVHDARVLFWCEQFCAQLYMVRTFCAQL